MGRRGKRSTRGALIAAATLVAAGCGNTTDSSELSTTRPPETPIPEADWPEAGAEAWCAMVERCCRGAGLSGARENCEQGQTRWNTQRLPATTSGAQYDGVMATRCAAELEAGACVLKRPTLLTPSCGKATVSVDCDDLQEIRGEQARNPRAARAPRPG